MKRAIILKHIFVANLATPSIEVIEGATSESSPNEKAEFAVEIEQALRRCVDNLKAGGLWNDVEESERTFLQAGIYGISEQQRIDAAWLAESIACLLWALQIIPKVPPYDQEVSHDLVRTLPHIPIRDLIKTARLRPVNEIKRQRNIAELWHWRARTRRLQEEGRLNDQPGGYTIEQIIELAALKGAENGDLPESIGRDFPALGRPYRDLPFKDFAMLTSIAQERHKALNWLCGFSPSGRWADTPTNT